MKKIFSNKIIRLFFITLFFDFLRKRNVLVQWCVNITRSSFAWARVHKVPRMHHLFNTLTPHRWIDSFSWIHCEKDVSAGPMRPIRANDFWMSLNKRWKEHPMVKMVSDIAYAYDINPNNVQLPTETAEEVVLALIDIYKSENQCYDQLGHPSMQIGPSISIDKYLTWDYTPQGFNYWCKIYNSICDKSKQRTLIREI